jgi:hypothetical protein
MIFGCKCALEARDFLHDLRFSEELARSKVNAIDNLAFKDEEVLEARALDVSQGRAVALWRGDGDVRGFRVGGFRIGDFGEEVIVWDAFQPSMRQVSGTAGGPEGFR